MNDKVVLITGASQGLGRELSIQLALLGARIALVSRQENLLSEVKEQITKDGGVAEYFICDVTDFHQVNSTVQKIVEKFGTIDVLINNAGVWISNQIGLNNKSRINQAFEINSIAPIYISEEIIPIFEKQNSGQIVFINSIAGLQYPENKDWRFYSATKWALTGYAKSLVSKFSGTPIKVCTIHPGPIDTQLDTNAGDEFGDDHSGEMSPSAAAGLIVSALTAPENINVDTLEFKKPNWNQ